MPLLDELAQLALARDRIRDVEPRELDLARARILVEAQDFQKPVVERTVILKLQGAQRMRDVFDGVRQRMREVVHRIDAPSISRAMMHGVRDAVDDGIAHRDVRRRHVDLGTQHAAAVGELARLHALEEREVFRDAATAAGTLLARLRQRAAIGADLLRREIVDVGKPLLDQSARILIELFKVVRRIVAAIAPRKTQPLDVLLDRVDVLRILLRRIRIVKAQVAKPRILLRRAEVQADRLRMTNVQIAVRFGRKARMYALGMLAALQIFVDDVINEIR